MWMFGDEMVDAGNVSHLNDLDGKERDAPLPLFEFQLLSGSAIGRFYLERL